MDKIEIHYSQATDHKTVMVSGAFGGLNLQGYLAVNFYIDKTLVPKAVTYEIDPKTGATAEVARNPPGNTQGREVIITTMMDYGTMKSFHEWIGQKIKELELANHVLTKQQETSNKLKS